jgi:7-cyano-7-deazaguanine synthase
MPIFFHMKAVVLLSGGLDSATVLGIALDQGYEVHPLTIDYHQVSKKELECARALCQHYNLQLKLLEFNLASITKSALLDGNIPAAREQPAVEGECHIPDTYVPGRNTIFLALALSYAEGMGAEAVFIGANAVDYSGYPDCREEYFSIYQDLINVGTRCGIEKKAVQIRTPILGFTKSEIIEAGLKLGVPYESTWSCYDARDSACGRCESCLLRQKGFMEAGGKDPIQYIEQDKEKEV